MLGKRKLEFADYWAIVKRRKWLLIVPTILLPAIALGITFFLAPRYVSQTLVLIEEQKVPDDYVKPVISADLDSRLASMKEQILSRSRIQPIIERYNLYGTSRMTMDDRVDKARSDIGIKPIHSEIAHAGGLPGFFITFSAADPHTAQMICGEITSLFVGENLRSREASAQGTTDFLTGQLADAKRSLDEQDAKLAAFQRKYGGKLPGEESSNLNMLTSLNTQLEAATQALSRMEQEKTYETSMLAQQLQSATPAGPASAVPATGSAPTPDQAELDSLLAQQAELSARYTADYPDVIVNKKRIADLRSKIARSSETAKGGGSAAPQHTESVGVQQLRAAVRAADVGIQGKRREQQELQNAVRNYQERISSSPLVEQEYKDVTRDYETAQKFYDDLLAKMNLSKMATALEHRQQGEQFDVMDQPNLPDSPSFPKRPLFLLVGLVAGLALGLGLTALLEHMDAVIRTERDLLEATQLPVLGVIGFAGQEPVQGLTKSVPKEKATWIKRFRSAKTSAAR